MRDLHVVAVSEDGRHVLLGPSKGSSAGRASHRVRLDARLVAAVRGELGTPTAELSPKEIQARLRAGESAARIAESAGMALTRVERFGGPVAAEMARMVDEARQGYVVRGRLGRSQVALGAAVDAHLGDHPGTWTTRREEDGRWRVQVGWTVRGRTKQAAWWWDPHARSLESVDAASAALAHAGGSAAPAERRPAARPRSGGAAARPARTQGGTAASRRGSAAKAAPAKAAPAKAGPAKAGPAKAAPAKAATKAATKPATRAATPKATKAAPAKATKAAPAKAVPPKPAGPKPVKKGGRPRLQVVPDPPKPPARQPKATASDARDGVRARASVPGWADVLLGTTPGTDR